METNGDQSVREAEAPEKKIEDMTRAMQMVVLESSRNKAQAAEEIASLRRDLTSALERNVGLRQQVRTRDEYITAQQDKIEASDEAAASMREEISRLQSEVDSMRADEKELYACRDRCVVLEKAAADYREAYEKAEADYGRQRDKVQALENENRHLKDNRQQWLDRDRDNQIVIQTLKDVISDLR